jgi:hypothetical protein
VKAKFLLLNLAAHDVTVVCEIDSLPAPPTSKQPRPPRSTANFELTTSNLGKHLCRYVRDLSTGTSNQDNHDISDDSRSATMANPIAAAVQLAKGSNQGEQPWAMTFHGLLCILIAMCMETMAVDPFSLIRYARIFLSCPLALTTNDYLGKRFTSGLRSPRRSLSK